MNGLALLPSAQLVPVGLQAEFGAIPSAMIPLAGRPAMSYIAEKYLAQGHEVAVAINEGGQHIRDHLSDNRSMRIAAIEVGDTASLGETVANALRRLDCLPGRLVINFADTFVEDPVDHPDTVCFVRQGNTFRWTTFDLDAKGNIENIREKDHEKDEDHPLPVFIGVFAVSDVPAFLADLSDAIGVAGGVDIDPFYIALRAYFNRLAPSEKRFLEVGQWWDFGHLDTYYETRRRAFTRERFFNRVTIDEDRGVLRKESANVRKFHDEIRWYLRLPGPLRHLSPRIFDYSLDVDNPFVEMEFYGYPVLSDVYLYGAWDRGVWAQILKKLSELAARMQEHRFVPDRREDLIDAMRQMYEVKTRERLGPVLADPRFDRFRQRRLVINGVDCHGLDAALEDMAQVIDAAGLYRMDHFSIVHGDLCLSNILYDPRNRIIRLVDPRGNFGPYDIYGDPRYDLAKLSHSIEGDYDFYVNGLFDLQWSGQAGITLRPALREAHQAIKRIYRMQMGGRLRGDIQVRLIESLLFLSMAPLHRDRPASQEAFLARGLLTFSEVARNL